MMGFLMYSLITLVVFGMFYHMFWVPCGPRSNHQERPEEGASGKRAAPCSGSAPSYRGDV